MRDLLLLVATCAALAACGSDNTTASEASTDDSGSPDPGNSSSGGTSTSSGAASSSSSSGGTTSSGGSSSGGSTSSSGGSSSGGTDASPPDGGGPPPGDGGTNAFTGAGAYTATLGTSARNLKHNFPNNTPPTNPAGTDCLSCHGGQMKNVMKFLFAGTVYTDVAGTKPAPMVEVRAREANGTGSSAMTDADGNYYFVRNTAFNPPVMGGVRNATTTTLMTNIINDGDCNSCHKTGGEGHLHIP